MARVLASPQCPSDLSHLPGWFCFAVVCFYLLSSFMMARSERNISLSDEYAVLFDESLRENRILREQL